MSTPDLKGSIEEDNEDEQIEDFDPRPEDEEPPRGRHMEGCLWSGGGWNCDGACPVAAETYREYCESMESEGFRK